MTKEETDVIDYVVICVEEFADRRGMRLSGAYRYLRTYKGIDFLLEYYDVEHTLSFDQTVDDLVAVCVKNGGPERGPVSRSDAGTGPAASGTGQNVNLTDEQKEMIEYTAQDIAAYLCEDYGMDTVCAMDILYASRIFEKLCDPETGLWLDGSAYVYELLKREPGFPVPAGKEEESP